MLGLVLLSVILFRVIRVNVMAPYLDLLQIQFKTKLGLRFQHFVSWVFRWYFLTWNDKIPNTDDNIPKGVSIMMSPLGIESLKCFFQSGIGKMIPTLLRKCQCLSWHIHTLDHVLLSVILFRVIQLNVMAPYLNLLHVEFKTKLSLRFQHFVSWFFYHTFWLDRPRYPIQMILSQRGKYHDVTVRKWIIKLFFLNLVLVKWYGHYWENVNAYHDTYIHLTMFF